MRTLRTVAVLSTFLAVATTSMLAQEAPPPPPPFMDALAPHGTWRNENAYGWYWRPFEADRVAGWRPYLSGGHWQWAQDAWNWMSDYAWGATVFHYGRWANVASKGWIWIPGEQPAAAWVQWVRSEGYWGWAPLLPEPGFAPGFNLTLQLQSTDFVFVQEGLLTRLNLDTVAVSGGQPVAPPPTFYQPPAPQVVQVPSPVYVSPPATTYVMPPTYYESPVVIRETRYVGSTVWWDNDYHGGPRRDYRDGPRGGEYPHGRPSYDNGRDSHGGGGSRDPDERSPRIVQVPTPLPAPKPAPHHVPVPSKPNLEPTPIRPGTPTTPNIYRPPPNTSQSKRADGVQNILEGRR